MEKLNVAKLMEEGNSGNYNLQIRKISNGIIVNINGNINTPRIEGAEPGMDQGDNIHGEYAYNGTATEIIAKADAELGIGELLSDGE